MPSLLIQVSPNLQVLGALRLLVILPGPVLHSLARQLTYGLHELLRTNAANIHAAADWSTLFTLLEVVGAGANPPPVLQVDNDVDVAQVLHDAGIELLSSFFFFSLPLLLLVFFFFLVLSSSLSPPHTHPHTLFFFSSSPSPPLPPSPPFPSSGFMYFSALCNCSSFLGLSKYFSKVFVLSLIHI